MAMSATDQTRLPPAKVIIDTDPGIDDINALLLALASPPEEIEVLAITPTYGNVDVKNCTRNVVSLFHVIEREREWRRSQGLDPGFDGLDHYKPIVAIGPSQPLVEQKRMADYFHGMDGLGGIHETHSHFFPQDQWQGLFDIPPEESIVSAAARQTTNTSKPNPHLFTPSNQSACDVILSLLAEHPPNTISIIAIGPLTNMALCAAKDPATLCRAKELVIMGGAIDVPGNITPLAEFNVYADSFAAARVFSLSSPIPASTIPPMPPIPKDDSEHTKRLRDLADVQAPKLPDDRRLNIVLFPLDCTDHHQLYHKDYQIRINPLLQKGSPMAEWHAAFMKHAFRQMETLHIGDPVNGTYIVLHDAVCIWYAFNASRHGLSTSQGTTSPTWQFRPDGKTWQLSPPTDIRVEPAGQWTRGACIVDRRDRKPEVELQADADALGPRTGDDGAWLSDKRGNRIRVCVGTPGRKIFEDVLWGRIFNAKK